MLKYHVAFYLPRSPGEMVVAEALDFPGAVTQLGGEPIKVWAAHVGSDVEAHLAPDSLKTSKNGQIMAVAGEYIAVSAIKSIAIESSAAAERAVVCQFQPGCQRTARD